MTLAEITSQLDAKYSDWGTAYKEDLQRIASEPVICHKITLFIEHAVRRTSERQNPMEAVAAALRFTGMSTFQLGLLIGLLLRDNSFSQDPPEDEQLGDQIEPCTSCNMSGEVCHYCGFSRYACECLPGAYSAVRCPVCEGTGELDS